MSIKISIFIAILLNLFMYHEALSGNYELLKRYPTGVHSQMFEVDESNLEVCKAYEKNLNSFPEIHSVMVCERPINSKLKDFIKPDWQALNVSEYKDVIKKMDKQSIYYRSNPNKFNEEKWDEIFKARIEEGKIKLHYAKLDIDKNKYNHVKPENMPLYMLKYDFGGKCDPSDDKWFDYSGIEYFITNKEINEIARIIGLGSLRGAFIYKGEIYFDAFSYTDSYKYELRNRQYEIWLYKMVYLSGEFARVPICRFRYIGKIPTLKGIK